MQQRFSASTVLVVAAIVGAAAFAAGRSMHDTSPSTAPVTNAVAEPPIATTTSTALPPGHPPVEATGSPSLPMGETAESALEWKVPSRWQVLPNPSSMRLATYRIPRAAGDPADPEMAVSQAGGSIDANVERWIGQFGPDAKSTAKRTTKKVAGMDVTIVEIEGTYSGGMGMGAKADPGPLEHWALLGAIVATPGMPHFFKMTGPAKSVRAARAELDELVASLSTH